MFDPIVTRKNGFTEGMLNFLLETKYDESLPMGNFARSELGVVISAWLVGLENEVMSVLPRCVDWLEKAIKRDEQFGVSQNLYRRDLYWAKAIADWMDMGWESAEWENARVYEEAAWRYEKRPWPMNEIIRDGLDDYMAFAYQASDDSSPDGLEGYENAIQMYEHWVNDIPPSLKKMLKPREYAYALCLYYARPETAVANGYTPEALLEAGRRMLQANLESKWFGNGQFIRGAMWLKVVYWNRGDELTPLQTILKAYDNMPNVPRPAFVGEG
ncbi:hypothetical protein ACJ51O_36375 (plasmid) [Burkholderia pyrrocinia]|uniref:hypothetical protein n=1 Tax=Burkholderia pyrrocinia TaxID=60550 RepID=UPI0038B5FD49